MGTLVLPPASWYDVHFEATMTTMTIVHVSSVVLRIGIRSTPMMMTIFLFRHRNTAETLYHLTHAQSHVL